MEQHGHDISLSAAECRELLATRTVGRVGWAAEAGPTIQPVAYLLHAGVIVFEDVAMEHERYRGRHKRRLYRDADGLHRVHDEHIPQALFAVSYTHLTLPTSDLV